MKLSKEEINVNLANDLQVIQKNHEELTSQLLDFQDKCRELENQLLINKGKYDYCLSMINNFKDVELVPNKIEEIASQEIKKQKVK